MKKIIIIVIIFLIGCTAPQGVVHEAAPSKLSIKEKNNVSKHFFQKESIKSISINQGDFYGVNEWYSDDTVIFSSVQKGVTSIFLHNLYSGQQDLFFETEDLVVKVNANTDHTLFAIHTVEHSGQINLTILDQLGNTVYKWSTVAEEVQFGWNPYISGELILTTFLPFLQFEVVSIDVTKGETKSIPVKNPFVQWINKDELGYLNWNQAEPSIDAPLFILNLDNVSEKQWIEHCIMFFSLYNTVLTISVDDKVLDHSLYSFYEGKTGEKLKEIYVPILNTFSEAWWIPSFDYDRNKDLFYYMEPKRPGDISEYTEGYHLKAIAINEDQTEVITTVENNVPIKLSPDGNLLLLGQQYEQLIHVDNQQTYNLIK